MHRRYSEVTPYRISAFCSRKFQKEMGIRLSDYIRDTRLEYAKIRMPSTEKTVEKIREPLQFCAAGLPIFPLFQPSNLPQQNDDTDCDCQNVTGKMGNADARKPDNSVKQEQGRNQQRPLAQYGNDGCQEGVPGCLQEVAAQAV